MSVSLGSLSRVSVGVSAGIDPLPDTTEAHAANTRLNTPSKTIGRNRSFFIINQFLTFNYY
jgi:hypothetical protein